MNVENPPIKGASETYKQLLSFLQILLLYWAVLPSKRQEFLIMISLDFDWQTNEFMLYCRTTQLREKSMMAYEQSLKLFGRWCMDEIDRAAFRRNATALQIADDVISGFGVVFIRVFHQILQHHIGFQLLVGLLAVLGNNLSLQTFVGFSGHFLVDDFISYGIPLL